MRTETIDKVADYCLRIFADQKVYELPDEYHYSHLSLCVIDAVFSIGVRYEGVTNTIDRFCNYYSIEKFAAGKELSTSDFLALMRTLTLKDLTEQVYRNKQRTSSQNGILKSEAVIDFLTVLQKSDIETFADIHKLADNSVEDRIKKIPGQKSGISFTYFLMLSGCKDLVKPDRWIMAFLEAILKKKVNPEDCQLILKEVVKRLNNKGFTLTPQKLDHLIWNYQRTNALKVPVNIIQLRKTKQMTIFDRIKQVAKSNKPDDLISASKFKEDLKSRFGLKPESVILSDYCYNRCNDGIKFDKHIFEYCGPGKYRYLGENYPYSGLIYHKPQGKKKEMVIGEWKNGVKKLH